jgi:hypothetical protein
MNPFPVKSIYVVQLFIYCSHKPNLSGVVCGLFNDIISILDYTRIALNGSMIGE